jgi:hypothetical protein
MGPRLSNSALAESQGPIFRGGDRFREPLAYSKRTIL